MNADFGNVTSSMPCGYNTPGDLIPRNHDASPTEGKIKNSPLTVESLPKGGGAIRGIGEKFAANPVTGTGSMSVPIAASPGRSGFGPQLSLSYDSGAGNGGFGLGWNLSLPSITRKTDKGLPRYFDESESDVFILSGAEDLVPLLDGDSPFEDRVSAAGYAIRRYRPRIEGLFARIERWTRLDNGDVHWRSLSKDNILTVYGKDSKSRIFDPDCPRKIFSWLISETRDDKGNAVIYTYRAEDGSGVDMARTCERNRGSPDDPKRAVNRYIKRVRYGNRTPLLNAAGERPLSLSDEELRRAGWIFELVFDYGEHDPVRPGPDDDSAADAAGKIAHPWRLRKDPFSQYRAGFELRITRLCRRVLMFHSFHNESNVGDACLVRSTDFSYSDDKDPKDPENAVYTRLLGITQCGYRKEGRGYVKRNLPTLEFEYSEPVVDDTICEIDPESRENLPIGVDGVAYSWTDLHGEGIPGILTEQAGAWQYRRNQSPTKPGHVDFSPFELVTVRPNVGLAAGAARFMDLAGDGKPDVVLLDGPVHGFYEHDDDEGWQPFRSFSSRVDRPMNDPNLRMVDLDGDGRADLLITEDDTLVWHSSLGAGGFGPANRRTYATDEEMGPRLVFADVEQSIHLADFSGDGLSDLARIRNGEICYWPNLGYGRFGPKVTMENTPVFDEPEQFDPKRLRLADIDGSGTTDLIYLHRDGVRLYFNQSGNGWSDPRRLNAFPPADDLASVAPVDLLGNGTICLTWASTMPGVARRPMRYLNLMGGRKPHLLVRTANNLGAETHVSYAPSTKFYLQDRRDGKPWISRLPFPIQVVERVETYDLISRNRFVSRYAYHHGFFDGEEREFRGFGMVEQWDAEEFGSALRDDESLPAANEHPEYSVPPTHTKTWYHTGYFADRQTVSRHFASEYYREPGLTDAEFDAFLLPDTILPDNVYADEEREACRALKGMMLRQELYADDAGPAASVEARRRAVTPYSVIEQDFTISALQHRGRNKHCVFFTHPRETITFHYERESSDPRIQHAITLDVDDYGNVRRELAIGYGRRSADSALSQPSDIQKQMRALITYAEHDFTNAVADSVLAFVYRPPLACESRSYELTGFSPESGPRFAFDEWARGNFSSTALAQEIPYYHASDLGLRQKRLIQRTRTLYRRNDLTALLPVGALESRAVPGESYKLALTPGMVAQVFQRAGQALLPDPAAVLEGKGGDGGGYVNIDGYWWVPGGRVFFSPSDYDTPASELQYALGHFSLPLRYADLFGAAGGVTYDGDSLLVTESWDALGNTVSVKNDYRVLQPQAIADPNKNRAEVAFDALGMVTATAVMGKETESKGDTLEGLAPDLDDATILAHLGDPLGDSQSLIGRATTRLVYDLFAYVRSKNDANPRPAAAYTLTREIHVAELKPGEFSKIQHRFSYSDGFGREIQQKIQAEPGVVPQRDPDGHVVLDGNGQPRMKPGATSPRWVGSGWTVYNNKGKPVRQFEPFFTDTHMFEFDQRIGVSPTIFYDPVERVVATVHPNATYEKTVFDPWSQATWDVNDTVLRTPDTDQDIGEIVAAYVGSLPKNAAGSGWRSWYTQRHAGSLGLYEQAAADKASAHADTPTVAPIFQPIVGPFYKGLAVTAYIHPQQFTRPATPAEVQKIIADYYAGEPFIRVLPVDLAATTEGGFYDVEANNDTNRVDIAVFGNEERMLIVARLDNLGKGASGAAVQAMNVHLGVEESLGLV